MKIFVILGLLVLLLVGCSGDGDGLVHYDYDGEVQIIIEPIITDDEPVEIRADYREMFAVLYRVNSRSGLYLLVQGYYAQVANQNAGGVIFSHIEHRGLYMVDIENIPNANEVFEHILALKDEYQMVRLIIGHNPTILFRITYDGNVYDEMPNIIAIDIEIIDIVGMPFDTVPFGEVSDFFDAYNNFVSARERWWREVLPDFRRELQAHMHSYTTYGLLYIPEWPDGGREIYTMLERNEPRFWAGFETWGWDYDYITVFAPKSVPNAQEYLLEYLQEFLASTTFPERIMDYIRFQEVDFSLNQLEQKRLELIEMGFCPTSVSTDEFFNRILLLPWPHLEFELQLVDEVDGHPMLQNTSGLHW